MENKYTAEEIAAHEEKGHIIGAPHQALVTDHKYLGATKPEPTEAPKTNAAGIVIDEATAAQKEETPSGEGAE